MVILVGVSALGAGRAGKERSGCVGGEASPSGLGAEDGWGGGPGRGKGRAKASVFRGVQAWGRPSSPRLGGASTGACGAILPTPALLT